jgi:hypothetical protein
METIKAQPKSSFELIAQLQDGKTETFTIQLSTPANTPGLRGIKGLKIQNRLSDIIAKNDQVTAMAMVQSLGMELTEKIYEADKDEMGEVSLSNLNLTSDQVFHVLAAIKTAKRDFDFDLETYEYIVENIFATFPYDYNQKDVSGEKKWYSITNFDEIVKEYIEAYKPSNQGFLEQDQSLTKPTGGN